MAKRPTRPPSPGPSRGGADDGRQPPGGGEPPGKGGSEPPRGRGNPDADPVRIHREYVEKRVGGGREPGARDYQDALDQWSRLAGSIRRPPSEETPAPSDKGEPTPDKDKPE